MIAEIAFCRGDGIYHLGTIDHSDEVDFRRRLAQAFGYHPDLIQETAGTPCNLAVIPNKIFEISQIDLRFSESDTISEVTKTPELHRYLNQL